MTSNIKIGPYMLLETLGVGSFGKVKRKGHWQASLFCIHGTQGSKGAQRPSAVSSHCITFTWHSLMEQTNKNTRRQRTITTKQQWTLLQSQDDALAFSEQERSKIFTRTKQEGQDFGWYGKRHEAGATGTVVGKGSYCWKRTQRVNNERQRKGVWRWYASSFFSHYPWSGHRHLAHVNLSTSLCLLWVSSLFLLTSFSFVYPWQTQHFFSPSFAFSCWTRTDLSGSSRARGDLLPMGATDPKRA